MILRPGRFVGAVVVPAAIVVLAVVLRHPKATYTSDSVAQQSIIRTWLDVGHGVAHVPADTWALKVPLYLPLELLPLSPAHRLLSAIIVLNAATFALLGLAALILAPRARWYELACPLGFLAAFGGGVGSNRLLPNYRNIELGLSFLVLALALRYLSAERERGPTRPVVGLLAAGLLAAFWFDDPYFAVLVGLPLAALAPLWYFTRDRDVRLLRLSAVLVLSLVLVPPLQAAVRVFGIEIDHTAQLSPAAAYLFEGLEAMARDGAVQLGLSRTGGWPLAVRATQVTVIVTLIAMMALSARLARHGWRERNLVVFFVGAHFPLAVLGTLVQENHPTRYMILSLFDLVVATVMVLPVLRRRGQVGGLLCLELALAASCALAVTFSATHDPAHRLTAGQADQRGVLAAVERTGALKGFAPYWSANVTSYLAGRRTTIYELACQRSTFVPRAWLSDTARLTRPADRTFLIWDPAYYRPRGCSEAVIAGTFGAPERIEGGPNGTRVYLFPYDIATVLSPGATGLP